MTKVNHPNVHPKMHKKLYKSKKLWVISSILAGASINALTNTHTVHADTTNSHATIGTTQNIPDTAANHVTNDIPTKPTTVNQTESSTVKTSMAASTQGQGTGAITGINNSVAQATTITQLTNPAVVKSLTNTTGTSSAAVKPRLGVTNNATVDPQLVYETDNNSVATYNADGTQTTYGSTSTIALSSLKASATNMLSNVNNLQSQYYNPSLGSSYASMASTVASFHTEYQSHTSDLNTSMAVSLVDSVWAMESASYSYLTSNDGQSFTNSVTSALAQFDNPNIATDIQNIHPLSPTASMAAAITDYNNAITPINQVLSDLSNRQSGLESELSVPKAQPYQNIQCYHQLLDTAIKNYQPLKIDKSLVNNYQADKWDTQVGVPTFDPHNIVSTFRWDPLDTNSAIVDVDKNGTALVHDGSIYFCNQNLTSDKINAGITKIEGVNTWLPNIGPTVKTLVFNNTILTNPIKAINPNYDPATNNVIETYQELGPVDYDKDAYITPWNIISTRGDNMYQLTNLQNVDLTGLTFSGINNLDNAFTGTNIQNLNLGNTIDATKLTSMQSSFAGMGNLSNLSFGNWDTSNVTNFSNLLNGVFSNINATTIDFGPNFTTKNGTNLTSIFAINNYGDKDMPDPKIVNLILPKHLNISNWANFDSHIYESDPGFINGKLNDLDLGPEFTTIPDVIKTQLKANHDKFIVINNDETSNYAFTLNTGVNGYLNWSDVSVNNNKYINAWIHPMDLNTNKFISFDKNYDAILHGLIGNGDLPTVIANLTRKSMDANQNLTNINNDNQVLKLTNDTSTNQIDQFIKQYGHTVDDSNYTPAITKLNTLLANLKAINPESNADVHPDDIKAAIKLVGQTDFTNLNNNSFLNPDNNSTPTDVNNAYHQYEDLIGQYNHQIDTIDTNYQASVSHVNNVAKSVETATNLGQQIKTLIDNYRPYQKSTNTVQPKKPSNEVSNKPTMPAIVSPTSVPVVPTNSTSIVTPTVPSQVTPVHSTITPIQHSNLPVSHVPDSMEPTNGLNVSPVLNPTVNNQSLINSYVSVPPTTQQDVPVYYNVISDLPLQTSDGTQLLAINNHPKLTVLQHSTDANGITTYIIKWNQMRYQLVDTNHQLIPTYANAETMIKNNQNSQPINQWLTIKQPIWEHRNFNFVNSRVRKLRHKVHVIRIVRQGMITRYQLDNGNYITSNQYFVTPIN